MEAERHPQPFPMSESARNRAAYAMSIFDWCRAYPAATADDLLQMIAAIESRIALSRIAA